MALKSDWAAVENSLKNLATHPSARPAVTAIRRAATLIKRDPELAGLIPTLSHASLMLSRKAGTRRIYISWEESGRYRVYLMSPLLETLKSRTIEEDSLLDTIRKQLVEL